MSARNRELANLVVVGILTGLGFASVYIAQKDVVSTASLSYAVMFFGLATALGRELGVPMRMCNLAHAEMLEACNRGWEGRDSRSVMMLQQERAGVEIAADPERVKQAAERAKSG